jgi:hypothetical protein
MVSEEDQIIIKEEYFVSPYAMLLSIGNKLYSYKGICRISCLLFTICQV